MGVMWKRRRYSGIVNSHEVFLLVHNTVVFINCMSACIYPLRMIS